MKNIMTITNMHSNVLKSYEVSTPTHKVGPIWLAAEVGVALGYKQGRHFVDFLTRSPEFEEGVDYTFAKNGVLAALKKVSPISTDTSEVMILTSEGALHAVMTSRRKESRPLRRQLLNTVLGTPATEVPAKTPAAKTPAVKPTEALQMQVERERNDMYNVTQVLQELRAANVINEETYVAHRVALVAKMTGYDFTKPPNVVIENVQKPVIETTPIPTGAVKGKIGLAATVDVDDTREPGATFVVKEAKNIDNYWSANKVGAPYGLSSVAVGKIAREHKIWGHIEEDFGKMVELSRNAEGINEHYCYGPKAREALHPFLQNEMDLRRSNLEIKLKKAAEKAAAKAKKLNGISSSITP